MPITGLQSPPPPTWRITLLIAAVGLSLSGLLFILILPVGLGDYAQAESNGAHRQKVGYLGSMLQLDTLFTTAVDPQHLDELEFYLFDQTEGVFMVAHSTGAGALRPARPPEDLRAGLYTATTITVAGHQWELVTKPTARYLAARHSLTPWAVLLIGIIFTGLLDLYLRQRWRDEAHLKIYGHIVSATHDLLAFVDRDYICRAVNGAYLRYYGRSRDETIGHHIRDMHKLTSYRERVQRAFSAITGYSESEAIGKTPRLLQSGRHDQNFYQRMWEAILAHGRWQGEIWNQRKNGEVYPEWVNISSVVNEAGAVVNYIAVFSDITYLKRSEAQLAHLAHYDPLTDLPNRLLFYARIEHALERARRYNSQLAVLFIDLDRFKNVNDSLGHPVGDSLLIAITQPLKEHLRSQGTALQNKRRLNCRDDHRNGAQSWHGRAGRRGRDQRADGVAARPPLRLGAGLPLQPTAASRSACALPGNL